MNRVRVLNISKEILIGLLSLDGNKKVRITGLPADARIVSVSDVPRFFYGQISLIIESETFSPVISGDCIPVLDLKICEDV